MNAVQVRNIVFHAAAQRGNEVKEWIVNRFQLLSGSLRPAMLNRSRQGENPYDFSKPQNQRNYLTINPPQWR